MLQFNQQFRKENQKFQHLKTEKYKNSEFKKYLNLKIKKK